MNRFLVALLCFAVPAVSSAGLPDNWQEIMEKSKYIKAPATEKIRAGAKAFQATGQYEIHVLADRFAFLVDTEGYALVTFDLSMEPLSFADKAFGAIGIGNWSIRNLWKRYKSAREKPAELLEGLNPNEEDAAFRDQYDFLEDAEKNLSTTTEDDKKRGYEEFAELEFTDGWIMRTQGAAVLASGKKKGFKPTSFTMADLRVIEKKAKKIYPSMAEFSRVIFGEKLEQEKLPEFMQQFKMDWDQPKEEFTMVWSPDSVPSLASAPKKKKFPIPGWVINYTAPYDILQYKFTLLNIDRQVAALDFILGKYASIVGIMVSRVTNGLRGQMENHENQLIALFEASLRGQYDTGLPPEFLDGSLDLLYLNKNTGNDDITNGPAKRRGILEDEAKFREGNLKWLAKKGFTAEIWPDERFATIYNKKQKRVGIVSLAIKGLPLVKTPSMHMYDDFKSAKAISRVGLEILVAAVRYVVPTAFYVPIVSSVGISIYLPGVFWDIIFRSRSFTEDAYEGHLLAAVNEKIAGRWGKIPGYGDDEMAKLQETFYSQRMSQYDVPFKHEAAAMPRNYQRIKDFLGGQYETPRYIVLDRAN